jgi:hypothetical protein
VRGIVYGKTFQAAMNKLERIVADYVLFENTEIVYQHKARSGNQVIRFKNNDVWTAMVATSSNTCGRRCNVVYIDNNIEDKDLEIDMRLTACAPPFQGIYYYYGQE